MEFGRSSSALAAAWMVTLLCGACGMDTEARVASVANAEAPSLEEAQLAAERAKLVAPVVPPQRQVPRANIGAEASWKITASSVGGLRLRARLNHSAVPDLASRYEATSYGEGQPLEGFVLDDPPVLAVVAGGPYAKWARKNRGEPASEAVKSKAMALAKAGKLSIAMLVVGDARAKTAAGIGVGQDFAAFSAAYPGAKPPEKTIGLWEEPSCVAQQEGVWFFFDQCEKLGSARIIRIVVRPATQRRR
jgi:hypothetical protein